MSIAIKTQSKASADHKTAAGKNEKKNVPDQFRDMEKPLFAPLIQTKLTIGQPGDHYEQEADRITNQVMRMPASESVQRKCAGCEEGQVQGKPLAAGITPWIQRQPEGGSQASASLESRLNSSKGGGQALPEGTRSFMESRMGADFSNVKIHTDSNAVQMSRELGAQAFTHGNHIYFNAGKYSPESTSGKHLLAHEMVHTVQQNSNIIKNSYIQRDIEGTAKIKGEFKVFTPVIKGSVGHEGQNDPDDVMVVQKMLLDHGYGEIQVNGIIDDATISAIRHFQKKEFPRWDEEDYDGRIDVVGRARTWNTLIRVYFNPDGDTRERKQFNTKRSILISPVDITSNVSRTSAYVADTDNDGLDDTLALNRKAAAAAPGVDYIEAKGIRHLATILQQYYDMGISIDNLYIISHGSYWNWNPSFVIGNETIANNGNSISRLEILKNLLSPNTKLVILACHIGGGNDPDVAESFNKKIAQKLGITIYSSRSFSLGSENLFTRHASYFEDSDAVDRQDLRNRPKAYEFLGQWLETTPGPEDAKVKIINSLKLRPDGTFEIAKSQFPTFSYVERALYEAMIAENKMQMD